MSNALQNSLLADVPGIEREGDAIYALMQRLFPICRSITGDGVRETLNILRESLPLEIHEVPTGTKVFDWTVPEEWNIREAWIKDSDGNTIIDFKDNNVHVVNYSVPVEGRFTLEELRPHLHSLPDLPQAIPYLTSYYNRTWGFCLSDDQMRTLSEGEYEVFIDADLKAGSLTYGECLIAGRRPEEVLISTYLCHPSLCNDNLSGVTLAARLADFLQDKDPEYSYRFLFIPETIGAITWLQRNEAHVGNVAHGLVVTCVGDPGASTYKKSRRGDAEIDRAALHVLKTSGQPFRVKEFFPSGSDERQFCSPGFDLPIGSLMRTPYWDFPEYHTSLDNLDFVGAEFLGDSFAKYLRVIDILENNARFINLNPKCEPQLGKRGLYNSVGGQKGAVYGEMPIFWVLNLCDGDHDLLAIAERAELPFEVIWHAARTLEEAGLLAPVA